VPWRKRFTRVLDLVVPDALPIKAQDENA